MTRCNNKRRQNKKPETTTTTRTYKSVVAFLQSNKKKQKEAREKHVNRTRKSIKNPISIRRVLRVAWTVNWHGQFSLLRRFCRDPPLALAGLRYAWVQAHKIGSIAVNNLAAQSFGRFDFKAPANPVHPRASFGLQLAASAKKIKSGTFEAFSENNFE